MGAKLPGLAIAMAPIFPSDKTFSSIARKICIYFLFLVELNSLLFFLCLNFFFGIFVKCFWQFGYAKFHNWRYCKLAIVKPSDTGQPIVC